jgi:cellulose synthase/poly-beta-1,6-N-acetylglucosamine synthase-like glycosyltransferase
MLLFVVLSILSLVLYSGLIIFFQRAWKAFPIFRHVQASKGIEFSVIIAYRNERHNLPRLITSLETQDYPSVLYEVILVDDHSEDGSMEYLSRLQLSGLTIRLFSNSAGETGKKAALMNGIRQARNEIVVTTDADCQMNQSWLSTLAAFYEQYRVPMIIGLVDIESGKGLFQKFQEIEFLSIIASGAAAAAAQRPIYCNAANFAFERELFYRYEDPLKMDIISGDDTLFMLAVKKDSNGRDIRLLKSGHACVTTKAVKTWKEFLGQQIRWASKIKVYQDRDIIYTGVLVLLVNLMMIVSLLFLMTGVNRWLFPLLWIGKTFPDFVFLRSFMKLYRKKVPLARLMLFEPLFSLIAVLATIVGLLFKYNWKGRKY